MKRGTITPREQWAETIELQHKTVRGEQNEGSEVIRTYQG